MSNFAFWGSILASFFGGVGATLILVWAATLELR